MSKNAIWNCKNPFQGEYKKVLCVCSAGLLRSPTAAFVLSQKPFNFNTRAAGTEDYALIPISEVLLTWADEIICMSPNQEKIINLWKNKFGLETKVHCLNIPDSFEYRNPELIQIITTKCKEIYVS